MTEQTDWHWAQLRRHRPALGALLGDATPLVGHAALRLALLSRLSGADTAVLFLLAGPAGSGKSAIVRWLKQAAADRIVDVRRAVRQMPRPLDPEGADVARLIQQLHPHVAAAGDRAVLVYDDADHDLRQEGITRFVREAIGSLDLGYLVIATTTALSPELFPIPTNSVTLDRRDADPKELDRFLDLALGAAVVPHDAFSDELRRSLYELSEQTADYRALEYVVEMLLAHCRATSRVARPDILYRILADDEYIQQLRLPAVRISDNRRMTFRRKDKTELLAEVLMRVFDSPGTLAEAASGRVEGFVRSTFLDDAHRSFRDAVMSLCLTTSPRDLVLALLGPADIRREINALRLDPSQLFDEREEQAHLLIRGLGFTLIDKPRGLTALKETVESAAALANELNARTDVVNGAGLTVIQQVESAMLDLLHFWGVYLFGSVRDLVQAFNQGHACHKTVNI